MSVIKVKSYGISPVDQETTLIPETEVQSTAVLSVTEETFSTPSMEADQLIISPVEEESDQNAEALSENNTFFSLSPVNRKKSLRAIRKFSSRF